MLRAGLAETILRSTKETDESRKTKGFGCDLGLELSEMQDELIAWPGSHSPSYPPMDMVRG